MVKSPTFLLKAHFNLDWNACNRKNTTKDGVGAGRYMCSSKGRDRWKWQKQRDGDEWRQRKGFWLQILNPSICLELNGCDTRLYENSLSKVSCTQEWQTTVRATFLPAATQNCIVSKLGDKTPGGITPNSVLHTPSWIFLELRGGREQPSPSLRLNPLDPGEMRMWSQLWFDFFFLMKNKALYHTFKHEIFGNRTSWQLK